MAGRGRGKTLPAWMTDGGGSGPKPTSAPTSAPTPTPAQAPAMPVQALTPGPQKTAAAPPQRPPMQAQGAPQAQPPNGAPPQQPVPTMPTPTGAGTAPPPTPQMPNNSLTMGMNGTQQPPRGPLPGVGGGPPGHGGVLPMMGAGGAPPMNMGMMQPGHGMPNPRGPPMGPMGGFPPMNMPPMGMPMMGMGPMGMPPRPQMGMPMGMPPHPTLQARPPMQQMQHMQQMYHQVPSQSQTQAQPQVPPQQQQQQQPSLGGGGQAQAQPKATSAAPGVGAGVATVIAPAKDPSLWREYTDQRTGRAYYHNRVTNETTYDKPDCLKTELERALPPCKWKEYPTPDGRMYYSDGTNSVWEEPEELKHYKKQARAIALGTVTTKEEIEAAAAKHRAEMASKVATEITATSTGAANGAQSATGTASPEIPAIPRPLVAPNASSVTTTTTTTATPTAIPTPTAIAPHAADAGVATQAPTQAHAPGNTAPATTTKASERKAQAAAAQAPLVFNSDEERLEAFEQLLRDMEVTSTMKWSEVNRACNRDLRWNALKTTGMKKQALAEFQTKRMKEEKLEKRNRTKKARDNFLKMLASDTTIDMRTRWREAKERLQEDNRFTAVTDDREREDMFNEFVTELARKEEEEKRAVRKKRAAAFKELLEEVGGITAATRWMELRPQLEEKEDPRYRDLDENERRNIFQDVIAVLRRQEAADQQAREEKRREEEKVRKETYREWLQEKVAQDEITAASRWREIKGDLEQGAAFESLNEVSSSAARDVFEEIVDKLQQAFRGDRKYLRDLLHDSKFDLKHDSSFEEYVAALEGAEKDHGNEEEGESRLGKVAPKHLKLYYEELHSREVAQHEEYLKRKKHRENRYVYLLEDYYYRSDHVGTRWSEAQRDLKRHSAYTDLDEDDRRALFDKYMAGLEEKLGKGKKKKPDHHDSEADDGEISEDLEDGEVDAPKDEKASTSTAAEQPEDGAEDGEDVDMDRHEKKREKKDKKKRKRKRSRSSSRSRSPESSDDERHHKKKKKKKDKKSSRHDDRGYSSDSGDEGDTKRARR